MQEPNKETPTIFDGPNKVKKRWAIGLMALTGILTTMENVPQWALNILKIVSGSVY